VSRILVTGLSGFIGKHCLPYLAARGDEIHAVTSTGTGGLPSSVQWHRANLLDKAACEDVVRHVNAERLLHLAWIAEPPLFWTSPANLDWLAAGAQLIKAFAEAGGTRAVIAGSCAEYAWPAHGPCIEDVTPIAPSTLYGAAKAALHQAIASYAAQIGLSYAWGRVFFVYGAGEPPGRIISTLLSNARNGEKTRVREPYRRLDYIHVDDVARAFVEILYAPVKGPINIGCGTPTTVLDIVQTVRSLGTDLEVDLGDSEGASGAPDVYADVRKLRDSIGFTCRTSLSEGLTRMLTVA
jgi:nucleoside-diphosphate-sugar epimerase